MANGIDWGTMAIGALVGVGCREQIKSAAKIAAGLAANLAITTAETVDTVAAEVNRQVGNSQNSQNGNGGKI